MKSEIRTESAGSATLVLEGDLSIQVAGELKEVLLQAKEHTAHLRLDLEKVTSADLSCLQVLCSAHRTLVTEGRRLSVSRPVPEPFAQTVREAGFEREHGCALDSQHNCLWATGDNA